MIFRKQSTVLPLFLAAMAAVPLAHASDAEGFSEEIVVRASASISQRLGSAGSVSVLDADEIVEVGATHVNEVLARVPGVWISRGSGQEHLAAIRSPVFTGAGACGEFSYLENGVPLRPAGFCNINNLFEANTEQASAIEVWRGPAGAVLGGNALHGAINVITPIPQATRLSVEAGPYDFYRAQLASGADYGETQVGFSILNTHSNGYRDATGYNQQKFHLAAATQLGAWDVRSSLTATLLNQETGGFVRGFEAFDDADLRRSNPNPEAFRDAWSLRWVTEMNRDAWSVKPYLRRSKMAFLQHFLPGQPLEKNDQTSAGVIVDYTFSRDTWDLALGGHVELMRGALTEFQAGPTIGSAFLVETRPAGLHYDYDVDSMMVAGYYNLRANLADGWDFVHSLRLEYLGYDYTNNHIVGNTRDDGSTCGFGGCLYTRPASRDDDFTNLAARFGVERALEHGTLYATVNSGFRPPQATELYRLRGGQQVADLDSENLYGAELGYRGQGLHVSAFYERTRNLILRDSDAFNISDGKIKSAGVELEGQWTLGRHTLGFATTYARHQYDFDRAADGRETIESGNDIDTAPRWIGNLRWGTELSAQWRQELEVVYVGEHYVNAANTADYDGHQVLNWRLQWQVNEGTELFARVINVLDERYADRADFAFGSFRYFPAMPRQLYLGVNMELR